MRESILEAALHELALQGLAGASLERIAKAAGVTKPMVHYYFGNKDGLCRAACARALAELETAVPASPAGDAAERIWQLVCAQLTVSVDALRVACACLHGSPGAFLSAADLHVARRARRALVGRLLAGATLTDEDGDALALLLDGALAALAADLATGADRDAVVSNARGAVRLLTRGLAPKRP